MVCERIAERHGVPLRETGNHFQAQCSLDGVVYMSGALRVFATALYKIANDIRWMSSGPLCGISEVRIPAVQPGSSIMPAKVNPVICEAVLMVCGQVTANDVAVGFGNAQGQFELNTMIPLMARNSIESAELLTNACGMFRSRCLDGLEVTDVAEAQLQRNPILVTALNAAVGYETAAKIAKQAFASGRTVFEVAKETTDLDEQELKRLLDPAGLCGDWGRNRE
jgi:fumarate hydratase class II